MSTTKACGGCGATKSSERCIGCTHDFGDDASAWVRKDTTLSDAIAEREAFEHWITTEGGYDPIDMQTRPDDVYVLGAVQEAWEIWQGAAREPSLDQLTEMAYLLELVPRGEVVCVQFMDVLRKQYRAAMEASGV